MREVPLHLGRALFEDDFVGFDVRYRGTSLIKNTTPSRTLQWPHALGPMVVQGGEAASFERGTPAPGSPPLCFL